jgi:hypothetical protein
MMVVGVLTPRPQQHTSARDEARLRCTISEPARREVLARLLKLKHERCA